MVFTILWLKLVVLPDQLAERRCVGGHVEPRAAAAELRRFSNSASRPMKKIRCHRCRGVERSILPGDSCTFSHLRYCWSTVGAIVGFEDQIILSNSYGLQAPCVMNNKIFGYIWYFDQQKIWFGRDGNSSKRHFK